MNSISYIVVFEMMGFAVLGMAGIGYFTYRVIYNLWNGLAKKAPTVGS